MKRAVASKPSPTGLLQDVRELIVSTRLRADANGSKYKRYPTIQTLHLRGVALKCSVSSC